nr:ABC transporter ATP-binding protein [Corynebacterium pacaense]
MTENSPTADALAPASLRDSSRLLSSLPSRPGRVWFALFTLISLVTVGAMVGTSNLLGFSVDVLNGVSLPLIGGGGRGMAALLAAVGAAILIEAAGRSIMQYLINSATRRLSVDLRKEALSSALRAPVPEVMKLGTGNVISRITQDIDNTVRIISMIGVRLTITIIIFPTTLASLVAIHWSFLLVFISVAVIIIPGIRTILARIPTATNIVSSTEARRNNLLLDTIRGIDTLRALRLGDWAVRRMRGASWTAVQARADRTPIFTVVLGIGSLAYGFLLIGVFIMAAFLSANGTLSIGAATAAVVLIVRMEVHVFNILFFSSEIQSAVTSLGRAVSLATLRQLAPEAPEPADLEDAPEVRVEKLHYSYPGGAAVLSGLDLTLAAGTTTALVGTSGAGKSTLAALIAGLQRPDSGRVSVAGIDTSQVSDTWTTRQITLISQEVHLFSGTLREDLLMAAPGAPDEVLVDALAAVGLHASSGAHARWFPRGLDTAVGAGAEELSPEVQQQISLARIVLRDPPVLIMDEATSEAGSDNARLLETAASQIARGRTSLVVAHRLDQAVTADRIIVMESGEIIEDGTHATLVAAGGTYARLYERWSS